jgi:hypothetical protein
MPILSVYNSLILSIEFVKCTVLDWNGNGIVWFLVPLFASSLDLASGSGDRFE